MDSRNSSFPSSRSNNLENFNSTGPGSRKRTGSRSKNVATANAAKVAGKPTKQEYTFFKGMGKKEALINIFIIEGEHGFYKLFLSVFPLKQPKLKSIKSLYSRKGLFLFFSFSF